MALLGVRGVVAVLAVSLVALTAPSAVRAQKGTAKLKVLGGEPGAVVRVNGEYLGLLPMKHAARVEAGTLFLEVQADGFQTYQRTVDVAPHSRKRVHVELVAEPESLPSEPVPAYESAELADPEPLDDPVTGFGMRTISIFDLKAIAVSPSTTDPATQAPPPAATPPLPLPPAPVTASSPPQTLAVSESSPGTAPRRTARTKEALAALRTPSASAAIQPAPTSDGSRTVARTVPAEQPLLPEDGGSGSPVASPDAMSPTGAAAAPAQTGPEAGDSYPGERESEGPDDFDPFNLDVFGGYSYLFMVLGHEQRPTAEQVQSMTPEQVERLANATPADLVDTVQGPGLSTGAAVWLQYNPVWLGIRLGYANYNPASILTLMGELGLRFQGSVAEVFFGFGLGSGWLYGVSPERIKENSGLALKFGLGVNFFVAPDVAFGLGVDAVGLFLAGKGISPSQIGDFDPERSNHPIGVQLPIVLNLGLRT